MEGGRRGIGRQRQRKREKEIERGGGGGGRDRDRQTETGRRTGGQTVNERRDAQAVYESGHLPY